MNQRIKQLAEQAGYTDAYYESDDGAFVPAEFDKEKFAELIVRECAGLATKEYNNRSSIHGNDLLKHFGVKE